MDVLFYVLRGYEDPNITAVNETIDPCRDFDIINQEILMRVWTASTGIVSYISLYTY